MRNISVNCASPKRGTTKAVEEGPAIQGAEVLGKELNPHVYAPKAIQPEPEPEPVPFLIW